MWLWETKQEEVEQEALQVEHLETRTVAGVKWWWVINLDWGGVIRVLHVSSC